MEPNSVDALRLVAELRFGLGRELGAAEAQARLCELWPGESEHVELLTEMVGVAVLWAVISDSAEEAEPAVEALSRVAEALEEGDYARDGAEVVGAVARRLLPLAAGQRVRALGKRWDKTLEVLLDDDEAPMTAPALRGLLALILGRTEEASDWFDHCREVTLGKGFNPGIVYRLFSGVGYAHCWIRQRERTDADPPLAGCPTHPRCSEMASWLSLAGLAHPEGAVTPPSGLRACPELDPFVRTVSRVARRSGRKLVRAIDDWEGDDDPDDTLLELAQAMAREFGPKGDRRG